MVKTTKALETNELFDLIPQSYIGLKQEASFLYVYCKFTKGKTSKAINPF